MLVGCGVCVTTVYSTNGDPTGNRPDILSVLESMLEKNYLTAHIQSCIKEYKEAKKKYNDLGSSGITVIKAFVKARDYLERSKADILSEENEDKDKITPQMRQKIANNEEILDSDFSETNLPECIRLYITALGGLKAADRKLRNFYLPPTTEETEENIEGIDTEDTTEGIHIYDTNTINPDFIPNKIAIYDRFIKAQKKLEECQDTIQLTAASRDTHQTLNPESKLPYSRT